MNFNHFFKTRTDKKLISSIRSNDISGVKQAIINGANVNINNKSGYLYVTPLILATTNGNFEIVKLLVSNGADVNLSNSFGVTPLIVSADADDNQLEITKYLLDHGANVNAQSIFGDFPLFVASTYGNIDGVKLMLEYGADCTMKRGDTDCIDAAIKNGNFEIAELLRSHILEQKLISMK